MPQYNPTIVDHNSLIVSFEMIFNTDIGLIRLLKNDYNNPKFINTYINLKYKYLINELRDRVNLNPLYLFLNDEFSDEADELYEEFKLKEEAKILQYSENFLTDFSNLLKIWCTFDELDATIICKNDIQKNMIDKWLTKDNTTSIKSIIFNTNEDLPKFDSIFLKNYEEVDWVGWFEGKNFYLSDELYNNPTINNSASDKLNKYIICNDIHNISLYSNKLYEDIKG